MPPSHLTLSGEAQHCFQSAAVLLISHCHLPAASLKYPEVSDLFVTFFSLCVQTVSFKVVILKISALVSLITGMVGL